MQGFLLGLSSGAACIAYCAPALLPYLLGEGKGIAENTVLLTKFLLGRLCGYLGVAFIAWLAGQTLALYPIERELLQSIAYIVLATVLLIYGVKPSTPSCIIKRLPMQGLTNYPIALPYIFGFLTGLNLCPPFLLVFVEAAAAHSLAETLWCFFTFFLGTALYFLPAPLLGAYQNSEQLKTVGKFAAVLMSLFYLYSGLIMLIQGVSKI